MEKCVDMLLDVSVSFNDIFFLLLGTDPFETVEKEIANNLKEEENDGWAEFDQIKRKKPSRPPPPRPPPPRPPSRPKPPAVNID